MPGTLMPTTRARRSLRELVALPALPARSALRALCAPLVLILAVACADAPDDVANWLGCDECPDELAVVVAHGDDALEPLLVALYRGASVPQQRNYTAQLTEEYRLAHLARLAAPASGNALSDSSDFVTAGLMGLLRSIQLRAAWAVRALDTPAARAALHRAWVDDSAGFLGWPAEVRALVGQLDSADPVTLVSVTSPVSTLAIGDSVQLSAAVSGPVAVPQTVAWVSTATASVVVRPTGVVRRVGVGSTAVRACSTANPTICGRVVIGMP